MLYRIKNKDFQDKCFRKEDYILDSVNVNYRMAENIENNIQGKVGETDYVQDNKQDKRISLAQSLSAYRCISTDKSLTWKQNYVNEKFSNDNILLCTDEEKQRFSERLQFHLTIANNIRQQGGTVMNGADFINILTSKKFESIKKTDRH